MNNMELIKNVVEIYETNKSAIAKKLGVSRAHIYKFIAGQENEYLMAGLKANYPKAFIEKEPIDEKALGEEVEEAQFTGENKTLVRGSQPPTKYYTKDQFLRLLNVKCEKECYFAKVPVRDLEKAHLNCPICGEKMFTAKERKNLKFLRLRGLG